MAASITLSQNPSALGQSVTLTATVTSIAAAPPDGEIVKFSTAGIALGTAKMQGDIAQVTTSVLAAGSH